MGIIMFGEKKQEEEIKNLKSDNIYLRKENARLEDNKATRDIETQALKTEHRLSINDLMTENKLTLEEVNSEHKIEVAGLESKVCELEESVDIKVEKEVSTQKKDLKKKEEVLEKTFTDKTKKLETEYTEKLSRLDRKLEEDKSSYRKYLKGEFNSRIDTLEKDNKRLIETNTKLVAENSSLNRTSGIFEGQVKSLTESLNKIVEALPTVSANITTPEVVVQLPKQEVAKGGGNNQEKKN